MDDPVDGGDGDDLVGEDAIPRAEGLMSAMSKAQFAILFEERLRAA